MRNKNAVIVPWKLNDRYVIFHYLDPDIFKVYSNNLRNWKNAKLVTRLRESLWDCMKIGAARSLIVIDEGWLLIYHEVDFKRAYRLGVAMLERESPERVLYRSKEPILEPNEDYELFGFIPNVVFSCGLI